MKDVVGYGKDYSGPKKNPPQKTTYSSGRWSMLIITEVFVSINWGKKNPTV